MASNGIITTTGNLTVGNAEINGALNHDGSTVGFYGNVPLTRQTVDFQGPSLLEVANTLSQLLQKLGDSFQGIGLINTNV